LEDSNEECFLYQVGICSGACIKKEHFLKYNLRFLKAFSHRAVIKWPFNSPIVIWETNPLNGLTEKIIVNNWCILGIIKSEDELENINFNPDNLLFDYDIYKILKKYITNSKNQSQIKPISKKELVDDF
jgi:hypothetical protein